MRTDLWPEVLFMSTIVTLVVIGAFWLLSFLHYAFVGASPVSLHAFIGNNWQDFAIVFVASALVIYGATKDDDERVNGPRGKR